MKKLISPYYLRFYLCLIAGMIAAADTTIVQILAGVEVVTPKDSPHD